MMEVNSVIICSKDEAVHHLPELSTMAGFTIKRCRLALVKPNICGLYHPSLELLSSVIQHLDDYAGEIVVGETRSMIHNPKDQFKRLGVSDLLNRFRTHVRTVDLSNERTVKVKVPNPHVLKELELPETVLNSDILVNVPKVGTHSTTRLTNALKNLFGLLPQKRKYSIYHPLGMDNVIADIAQVIKPDLNVVDAGDRVIIGTDALAVDIVACGFLDINPLQVKHLRLVSEDRGEDLEDFMGNVKITKLQSF